MTVITTATASLTVLPEDLLLHIFPFFNEKDLAVIICKVNTAYKKMSEQEVLWEDLTKKKLGVLSKAPEMSWKSIFTTKYLFQKNPPKRTCYWPCRNYYLTTYTHAAYVYDKPEKLS
jgi:hypothetical protein